MCVILSGCVNAHKPKTAGVARRKEKTPAEVTGRKQESTALILKPRSSRSFIFSPSK